MNPRNESVAWFSHFSWNFEGPGLFPLSWVEPSLKSWRALLLFRVALILIVHSCLGEWAWDNFRIRTFIYNGFAHIVRLFSHYFLEIYLLKDGLKSPSCISLYVYIYICYIYVVSPCLPSKFTMSHGKDGCRNSAFNTRFCVRTYSHHMTGGISMP